MSGDGRSEGGDRDGQAGTLAFLASTPDFGEEPAGAPILTHISAVLLRGKRAIKLKRAVHLPYVDFSTPGRRLAACERELELNRRTAPALYRAVRRVTRHADGGLELDGDGALVDAVVEMRRFPDDALFDRLPKAALTPPVMTRLARNIAAFHRTAPVDPSTEGAARMAAVLDGNRRALADTLAGAGIASPADVARYADAADAALEAHAGLMDARASAGKVRRCHGDLHLRNICLLDGEPTLFDCLEFDEELATTDVLYDLAFLLMDLWHRGLRRQANLVLNRYLDAADEADGLPLLPLFMSVRAAVRAHVAAARGGDAGEEAGSYFALAAALLEPRPARLVAIGGFSGSGKSTVAAAVAPVLGPAPGARILASDRIRKASFGVAAETRLPPEAYEGAVSQRVYARLAAQAAAIAGAGHAVVADAVFDRAEERARIAQAASEADVPFEGLWLDVPLERLVARVAARRGDASDATPEVVRAQVAHSLEGLDWARLPADRGPEEVSAAARARLAGDGGRDQPALPLRPAGEAHGMAPPGET
ncbi:AAA family ATPase [Bosea sp. 117]|uniref:bifunctional aminoglycoside phosphotransferase/ATP-binding protein n=1 Tax=Bosea sp. 117 TaxID=1125973 RepID=UPI000A850860|nr:AAA family ATPase [Bosea sp. 117]